jgi:NAD-dependent deacetylase
MAKSKDLTLAKQLLKAAHRVCVLTGAGISAESGLKTFRDAGGLWEDHPVEKVATPEGFARDPKLVWQFYNARRKSADVAAPNPAHLSLARMELIKLRQAKQKPKGAPAMLHPYGHGNGNGNGNGNGASHAPMPAFTLLTQNIDGLHQQAGSSNVVELHGSIWKVRCSQCGRITSDHPIELPILPKCDDCSGLLRPHVVWFGENLDPEILKQADQAAIACDTFLVIGTSGIVQPAASYPFLAARKKIPVIEINLEKTAISPIATVILLGKAGDLLPKLISDS